MELKDVKVELVKLKTIGKELNEWGGSEKKVKLVAIKREKMIEAFMVAVESVPEDQEAQIPVNVATLYNDLSAQLQGSPEPGSESNEDDKSGVAEEVAGETSEDGCPVFKKGWDVNNADCQACEKGFPDEYEICKTACTIPGETPKKAKKARKPKGERTPRPTGPSAKLTIWTEWDKSERKAEAEELQKNFGPEVKLKTVKAWIRSWTNGKCLPGGKK